MSKDGSHTNNLSPLYLRVLIFEVWKIARNSPRRLTYNIQIVSHPGLHQFIMIIPVPPIPGVLHDTNNGFLDIT